MKIKKFCDIEEFEKLIVYDKNNKSPLLFQNYSSIYFKKISIFDKKTGSIESDKKTVEKVLQILINSPKDRNEQRLNDILQPIEKIGIGSMLGMAIGDAMGSVNEFKPVKYEYNEEELKTIYMKDINTKPMGHFRLEPGQWTDDTSMGLCIADSLIVNNGKDLDPIDLMNRFYAWWKGGYNNAFRNDEKDRSSVGLGGNISMALFSYRNKPIGATEEGDKNTSGNGSIMRNGAIPICFYYDLDKALKNARIQSLTTHQGLEAKECCALLTYIIVKIIENKKNGKKFELNQILDDLAKNFKSDVDSVLCLAQSKMENNDINRDWNWKKKDFKYSPSRATKDPGYIGAYAMDNMAMSLHILYYTKSFKEAILKAVNLRGDSDSVASVVGQIAGAYYPLEKIPNKWIEAINKWDNGEIALRGYILTRLNDGKSYYKKLQNKLEKCLNL